MVAAISVCVAAFSLSRLASLSNGTDSQWLLLSQLMLPHVAYFAFGRSIAFADIKFDHLMHYATSFGVSDRAMLVIVGPLLLAWHEVGRVLAILCESQDRGSVLRLSAARATHVLCLEFFAGVAAVLQRSHLFYWSVFLPKLLFVTADALIVVLWSVVQLAR